MLWFGLGLYGLYGLVFAFPVDVPGVAVVVVGVAVVVGVVLGAAVLVAVVVGVVVAVGVLVVVVVVVVVVKPLSAQNAPTADAGDTVPSPWSLAMAHERY